jgi:hypothetical protein
MKKLPDFLKMEIFGAAFEGMGINDVESTAVDLSLSFTGIDPQTIQIIATEGLEVDLSMVSRAKDGTLEYAGRKIVVYIRDQRVSYYRRQSPPNYKFHVAWCQTLEKFFSTGRAQRYVVCNNPSGRFTVIRNGIKTEEILQVCYNCLNTLDYEGFRFKSNKSHIIKSFDLGAFLEKFATRFRKLPVYTDRDAPVDEYPKDWADISRRVRSQRRWTCERCYLDLSWDTQYLDVHHKNTIRSDCSPQNLQVLCVYCHSIVDNHSHVQSSDRFKQFLAKYGRR